MRQARSRLLLSLFLLALAGVASWSNARAGTIARGSSVGTGVMVSAGATKPLPSPYSGEPDIGNVHPVPKSMVPDGRRYWSPMQSPWQRVWTWISRVWIMRMPGVL